MSSLSFPKYLNRNPSQTFQRSRQQGLTSDKRFQEVYGLGAAIDHQDLNSTFHPETVSFSFTPQNTTLHINRTLSPHMDLDKQDMFSWVSHFRETSIPCAWDQPTSLQVLLSPLSPYLLRKFNGTPSLDSYLHQLLKLKYTLNQTNKYYLLIEKISQKKLSTRGEFITAVYFCCSRLEIPREWSPELKQAKREEKIFSELTSNKRLEVARLNIYGVSEIVRIIKTVEDTIYKQLSCNQTHIEHPLIQALRI